MTRQRKKKKSDLNTSAPPQQSERPPEELVRGVLRVHPRGFGFLSPDDAVRYPQDIFIPKHLTLQSVDGDKVEVVINPRSVSEKGPEGRVVTIVERARSHIAGTIRFASHDEIVAYVPLLGISHRVIVQPYTERSLIRGDRVILKVVEWGTETTPTIGEVSHYLGHISDPACDIPAAIEEYELRRDFPCAAVQQAKGYGEEVPLGEIKGRRDFRKMETFTIDPPTAKDFDDALSISKDSHGNYHLYVHIADVSHYVKAGSPLDREARLRCNSTYFPGYCLPMLPHELSDNLCSLKEGVNRLTITAAMRLDKEGTLLDYQIDRSVICSAKRMSYPDAKQIIDGALESPHAPALKLMVELCHLLMAKRQERGSIALALPDSALRVDAKGVPLGIEIVEYDISHQLVEEFMLKANELIATHLSKHNIDLSYRIHEEPSEGDIRDFIQLARTYGFKVSDQPTSKEMQELFDEASKTAFGKNLATAFIRSMKLAIYSPHNIGHYGLSLEHYCHFTSPIRRYVDLVVHRLLFEDKVPLQELETLSNTASEQERISSRAEGAVTLLKKLRLLQAHKEKESLRTYNAVVMRVKNFGIIFELVDLMIEGSLHVSELENDYFDFDPASGSLRGRYHGIGYQVGDKLQVVLNEVDLITLESKWGIVGRAGSEKPTMRQQARPQRKFGEKRDRVRPPRSGRKRRK